MDDPGLTEMAMTILCQLGTVDDLKRAGTKAAVDAPSVRRIALRSLISCRSPGAGPILLDLYKSSANDARRSEITQAYLAASRNQTTREGRRKMLKDATNVITEPRVLEVI